jgi:formylglycine-generating enzyme required for sulfatase activity
MERLSVGISIKMVAKEILMAGLKRVPLAGDAFDVVDNIAKSHETLRMQQRLQEIETGMTSFDRRMRDLVKSEIEQTVLGLGRRDLNGPDFTHHIKNLYDIRQNGWSPALFQGLLERSVHWGELCKNPSHYGSVLADRQALDTSKLQVFIDADKTRILELTPFALHGLLAHQHDDTIRSNIVTSADVWALVDTGTPKQPGKTLPKIGDIITNSLGMTFAWVPPGDSWLGEHYSSSGGDGKPGTTKFTLPRGLWCGVYPVTQAEWQDVMGSNPSHFKGNPRYPVESVSWNDVQKFIEQLNQRTRADGLVNRLPTEQEWEYICRGGPISQDQSKYHFYFARSKTDLTPAPTNDLCSTQANFNGGNPAGSAPQGPYLQRPCDVGLYLPNPLGICDLHGNVWEWTSSQDGSHRVFRGGSWRNHGERCTAANWLSNGPDIRYFDLGFRLLAVPSGKK